MISSILQAAPADRTADVDWTTMKTIVVLQTIFQMNVTVKRSREYTVPNTGQWDLISNRPRQQS